MISHCWEIFPTIILTRKLRFFKTLSLAIPWIGEFEGKKPERLSFKFPRTKNENDSHVTTPGEKKAIQDSSRPSNGVGSTESIPAAQSSETSASTLKKKWCQQVFLALPNKRNGIVVFWRWSGSLYKVTHFRGRLPVSAVLETLGTPLGVTKTSCRLLRVCYPIK